MSDLDLIKHFDELLKRTTPEPWSYGAEGSIWLPGLPRQAGSPCIGEMDDPWDAVFVADMRNSISIFLDRYKEMRDFVEDIYENWDCDRDAHRYATPCRRCWAGEILNKKSDERIDD